eukprot:15301-Heterococcus_DN1.PRE.1
MSLQSNGPLMLFMRRMGIQNKDALRMYSAYCKVDTERRGQLDINDFFDYFRIEFSEYNCKAFK